MIYGRQPKEKGEQGIVVATFPWGGTRHIVFLGVRSPLYLVPASFFHATEEQMINMSKSQRRNRTQSPFNVGSLVEVGVDAGSNVLGWISKVPMTAAKFSSLGYEGGYPYLDADAVTNGSMLWASNNLGDITEKMGQRRDELEGVPTNVPLKVRLEVHLHYGDYEQTQCIPTSDFEPTYTLVYYKLWVNQEDGSTGIIAAAPWNKQATPHSPPAPSPTRHGASFGSSPSRSGSSSGTTSSRSETPSESSYSRSDASSNTRSSGGETSSKSKESATLPAAREPLSDSQVINISDDDEGEVGDASPEAEEVIEISDDEEMDSEAIPTVDEEMQRLAQALRAIPLWHLDYL